MTLAPQGLRQVATAAGGHEGLADELRPPTSSCAPRGAPFTKVGLEGSASHRDERASRSLCGAQAPGLALYPCVPGPRTEPGKGPALRISEGYELGHASSMDVRGIVDPRPPHQLHV